MRLVKRTPCWRLVKYIKGDVYAKNKGNYSMCLV